ENFAGLPLVEGAAEFGEYRADAEFPALLEEEVRIDRRAVPADSDSGLQEVRFAVVVGGLEDGREVNPGGLAVPREFVGEGDIDVAVDHSGELDHFRGFKRADVDHRRAEVFPVERRRVRG